MLRSRSIGAEIDAILAEYGVPRVDSAGALVQ